MTASTLRSLAAWCGLAAAPLIAQTSDHDHVRDNVFAQLRWRELGPVCTGGRIVDVAVHPQHPQVFWVAAASGGLWKTENGGVSFSPQFQDAYSISIGDIAVAPSNGDVVWVGTGEANNQRSSYWGNGVYRSTDGGKTFTHCGLDGTDHIGRIVVHPQNPDIAWVAALGALYTQSPARGLYKTTDGGKTWKVTNQLGPDTGFVDVAIDPKNPDTLFAASYERRRRAWNFTEGGQGSRLWKSTDGGETWKQLAGGLPGGLLGRIGVDVFAGDGKTVYATIENLNPLGSSPAAAAAATGEGAAQKDPEKEPEDDDAPATPGTEAPAEVLADPVARARFLQGPADAQDPERRPRKKIQGGEVWRSDDGGDTWKKTNGTTDVGGNPGYYYGQIRIDPQDRETVYVLSIAVFRSTDGGATWTPKQGRDDAFAHSLHSDHHALWLDPQDGKHALLGNDGGLAVTWDAGKTWDHLAHLPIAQFYTVAADLASPYRVYGGLQDNGTWGFPIHGPTSNGITSNDAYRVDGGDGFHACIDPDEPDVVYSESQFGGMSRQDLHSGERRGIQPKAGKGEQPLRWNWNTPIVLSPHAGHTVYTGSQFVHRSRDRGDTWTTISPDLTTNSADKKQGNVPHCTITSIAESPRREGRLWVGTDDGRVWTTRDGGQRWVELSNHFPPEVLGLWVSCVEASPHSADTAFVAFSGYREDRRSPFVFRTDDGGDTWLPIEHDLPLEPVNVIRQHPRNPNVLLVGTEMGIYVSVDDGAAWYPLGSGLPRVAVHDLLVHPREEHVLVATHGRGLWALDAAALATVQSEHLARPFVALPPSDGVLLPRAFSPGNVGARTWAAANPFVAPTFRWLLAMDSESKVTVQVLDAAGKVLWSQDGDAKAGYHEITWGGGRGRGPGQGGQGGGFPMGRGGSGPRPGHFAVKIACGEASQTFPFEVLDRRGPSSVLGGIPGPNGVPGEEATEVQAKSAEQEEEEEEEAEAAQAAAEAEARAHSARRSY